MNSRQISSNSESNSESTSQAQSPSPSPSAGLRSGRHARRTRLPRLARLGLLSLGCAGVGPALSGQAEEPMVYTVGLLSESSGQAWAYLHWRSTALELFAPRAWSIWRKDGLPGEAGEYVLDAVVQVQRHPAALGSLFERAESALGEDLQRTREALSNLFEDILPDSQLSNGQLASAILQGVEGVPELINTLQISMRAFPSMAMAMGTAHATPIRANGPVTFEIRQRPSAQAADESVIGRVTVNAAAPLVLPAPGPVSIVPDDPERLATSDLSVSLRWADPPTLRRLSLAQHGYRVWRVPRALAEAFGWQSAVPDMQILRALATDPDSGIATVNRQPILVSQALDLATLNALNASGAHTPSFVTDHESRFPGYPDGHYVPVNGDSFYYYVTALDLLGREGLPSMGVLGTFCSRLPPRVPRLLSVENDFTNDGSSGQHRLRIHWAANPPEDDKNTSDYAVYRWGSTDEMTLEGGDPTYNLIAIIPHPASGATVSYLDDGPGAPIAPADYSKTYWYTVRAIDNAGDAGACNIAPFGGNISGHSPPMFGVLRDRISPGPVTGEIGIQCAYPRLEFNRIIDESFAPAGEFSPDFHYIDIVVERPVADPNFEYVELSWGLSTSETSTFIGRFSFQGNQLRFTYRLVLPLSIANLGQLRLQAEARSSSGNVSYATPYVTGFPSASKDEPPIRYSAVQLFTWVDYELEFPDTTGRGGCRAHKPTPPDVAAPQGPNGILLKFRLPPGSRQYKIYYQIDSGPLTLLRERSGTFPANTDIEELWEALPVFAFRACFFVQAYDRHGNSGPMSLIGCTGIDLKFGVPAPTLKTIEPAGMASSAEAIIRWAAPRPGIERFELIIHNNSLQANPLPDGWLTDGWEIVDVNGQTLAFRRYLSPLLDNGFGNAGLFDVTFSVPDQVQLLVAARSVSIGGSKSQLSNFEYFNWTAPEAYFGPNVPWPSMPLPAIRPATAFHPDIQAVLAPDGGRMIRVGVAGEATHYDQETQLLSMLGSADNRLYPKTGDPNRRLFPLVLYRMQVADATWPEVSKDMVQVSPLMKTIATTGSSLTKVVQDPFIYVSPPNRTGTIPAYLYLRDTQPAVGRATYRYYLVLFDPQTSEIDEILVTNDR